MREASFNQLYQVKIHLQHLLSNNHDYFTSYLNLYNNLLSMSQKRPPFIPTCKSVQMFNSASVTSFNAYSADIPNKNSSNPETLKKTKSKDQLVGHDYDKYFDYDENIQIIDKE